MVRGIPIEQLPQETIERLGLSSLVEPQTAKPRRKSSGLKRRDKIVIGLREEQVLILLKEGYKNEEIAAKLGIHIGTVKYYVRVAIFQLQAKSTLHAVILAIKQGLIGLWDTVGD